MTAGPTGAPGAYEAWVGANQRHLGASLQMVKLALRRYTDAPRGQERAPAVPDHADANADANADAHADAELAAARAQLAEATAAMPAPAALDTLCVAFGLSAFERDLLLLCAAVELDAGFGPLVARAQPASSSPHPTLGLALALFPGDAHWSALVPAGPLRHFRLIELDRGEGLTRGRLRIDERVLHHLTGIDVLDDALQELLTPVTLSSLAPASHLAQAERIARSWSTAVPVPLVQLCGADWGDRMTVAAGVAQALGLRAYALRAPKIPHAPAERDLLATLWEREVLLHPSALVIDCDDLDGDEHLKAAVALGERLRTPLFLSSAEPLKGMRKVALRVDVARPPTHEQRQLWRLALGERAAEANGAVERVVAQFSLPAAAIYAAALAAGGDSLDHDGTALWDACRAQARPRLHELAQRIDAVADWNDLVLPDHEVSTLREVALHVRHRARVYEDWGFARKSERGLGISALFSGASGTGKTMAAEVLARELRLDLYRIDLSQAVSKYIGETEKNLRRIFDAADQGGAVLLFDEADALFGKRSEVKDSHDRYANIEVSYLLQCMEAYRGLAVLTTNQKEALDSAFLRRLRFVVQFPFPDVEQRREIWRRVFPAATPIEALDVDKLARMGIAGGNIRNIAMNAAFLAGGAGEAVRMVHVLRAARSEYAKLERPLTEIDIGGLA